MSLLPLTPRPTAPTRGEVPLTVLRTDEPSPPPDTFPLMGEARRGCWEPQCDGSNLTGDRA